MIYGKLYLKTKGVLTFGDLEVDNGQNWIVKYKCETPFNQPKPSRYSDLSLWPAKFAQMTPGHQ